MPLYGNYPPPGAPGGGPPRPVVGWGPEFGPGGQQGPYFAHGGPPPKKRRTGLVVSLLLLGGLAVIVAAVALGLRSANSPTVAPSREPTLPTGQPTSTPTAGTTTGTTPSVSTPTTSLPTAGTPTRAATPTPTPTTQPPLSTAEIVTKDGFYTSRRQQSVGCREQRVTLTSRENLQAYYTNLANCLNRAWAPLVQAGQDPFVAPKFVFWTGTVQSPCAGGASVSFYCGRSQTIYLKYDDDIKLWNRSADDASRAFSRMWATYTGGHEYGHHLQQITGILPAAQRLRYDAPDRAASLEMSRRIELQASCLAAVFMGTHRSSYGITGLDLTIYRRYVEAQTGDENNNGGPRDHGRRASHKYWAARGFDSPTSGSCNTFTASASKVS